MRTMGVPVDESAARDSRSAEGWFESVLDAERRGELLLAFDLAERGLGGTPRIPLSDIEPLSIANYVRVATVNRVRTIAVIGWGEASTTPTRPWSGLLTGGELRWSASGTRERDNGTNTSHAANRPRIREAMRRPRRPPSRPLYDVSALERRELRSARLGFCLCRFCIAVEDHGIEVQPAGPYHGSMVHPYFSKEPRVLQRLEHRTPEFFR